MTTAASDVIQMAAILLVDPSSVQWPVGELVIYLNAGQIEIISAKPDANAKIATGTFTPGTRQDLSSMTGISSSNPLMLMDVIRNMAATSTKAAITRVERESLDRNNPLWHADTQSITVDHFAWSDKEPNVFYCTPPAAAGSQAEISFAAYPVKIAIPGSGDYTAVVGNLSVLDKYVQPLVDYVLYRAYSKDAGAAANVTKAAAHYSAFASALGIKVAGIAMSAPPKTIS